MNEKINKIIKVLLHYFSLIIILITSIISFVKGYGYQDVYIIVTSLYVLITSSYFLLKMFEEAE